MADTLAALSAMQLMPRFEASMAGRYEDLGLPHYRTYIRRGRRAMNDELTLLLLSLMQHLSANPRLAAQLQALHALLNQRGVASTILDYYGRE